MSRSSTSGTAFACGRPSRNCGSPIRRRRCCPGRARSSVLLAQQVELGPLHARGPCRRARCCRWACRRPGRSWPGGWRAESRWRSFPCRPRNHAEAQHDEAGQVLVVAAQAVVDPGAEAGPAGDGMAGVQEQHAVGVQRQVGLHRADDGQVVGAGGDVREQVADRQAGLAVAAEAPGAFQPLAIAQLADGLLSTLLTALPSSSASFGLGSNESTCETPPSMKQKMTFLARGFDAAPAGRPDRCWQGAAAKPRSASRADRAREPKPLALARSSSRRVQGSRAAAGAGMDTHRASPGMYIWQRF